PRLSRGYHFYVPFFFSSRRRHTRFSRDWSSDVCSSDLHELVLQVDVAPVAVGRAAAAGVGDRHRGAVGPVGDRPLLVALRALVARVVVGGVGDVGADAGVRRVARDVAERDPERPADAEDVTHLVHDRLGEAVQVLEEAAGAELGLVELHDPVDGQEVAGTALADVVGAGAGQHAAGAVDRHLGGVDDHVVERAHDAGGAGRDVRLGELEVLDVLEVALDDLAPTVGGDLEDGLLGFGQAVVPEAQRDVEAGVVGLGEHGGRRGRRGAVDD